MGRKKSIDPRLGGKIMPLVRFTKLTSLVRNHDKKQTMRKPRKRPLKEGDNLHVYIQEKLGNAKITSIKRIKLRDITEEIAKKDGFNSIAECQAALCLMHNCDGEQEFDVIEYEPQWLPHEITFSNQSSTTIGVCQDCKHFDERFKDGSEQLPVGFCKIAVQKAKEIGGISVSYVRGNMNCTIDKFELNQDQEEK